MGSARKILVVDDEKALVQLCQIILEAEGFDVYSAYNGKQALQLLHEKAPDLVILDVMMPGMSGIEVCRRIRASAMPQPLILMYTADERGSTTADSLSAGANAVLSKEMSIYDMPGQVTDFLKRV